ncbi:hypothetical protein M1N21_00270 [Dehalococcoidia bacterium]|nr:hypothetical protein [Dehalococcoidia bacterium]
MNNREEFLTKEMLLRSTRSTIEVKLEGFDLPLLMRPLSGAEVDAIARNSELNDFQRSAAMIAASLVEPKLAPEEVQQLDMGLFAKLSDKTVEISGLEVRPFRAEGVRQR